MILYSDRDDHYSQRVRIVLAEKDITAEIHEAKPEETPEDILSISPYHKLPILVDRDQPYLLARGAVMVSSTATKLGVLGEWIIARRAA